jgi:hypothetical protein
MNEPFNIVTSFNIISEIKVGSKYFRVNLGLASTVESQKSGDRVLNDKDQFAYSYNNQYKTTIYAQGNIGNIRFYTDHYIKDDVLAVYYNLEEFVIPFDRNLVREKGIDAMIGLVLKTVKDQYQERQDKIEEEKKAMIETKKEANPDLVHLNPGAVTYEDLKAYMEKKRAGRI